MSEHIFFRLEAENFTLHSMEILQNGASVLHYGADKRFPVYSITKSVTALAFALACDEGVLSAEHRLSDFLEERYQPLMRGEFQEMPFRRFLTMTAGEYPFRPAGEDWLAGIFALPTDYSDCGYHYSNIPAYLVGAAVENAVGGDLMGYLNRQIFAPLGISKPPHQTSPEGHFYGATGMELTAQELSRLGQLVLQGGTWDGTPLIREETVRELTAPRIPTSRGDHYGYFFRVADDHVSMVGKWGQRCMIYPARKLVVAYLSHQPERSEALYETVRDAIREETAL